MFEEVLKVRLGEPDGFYLNEDSNLYSAFEHSKQYGKRDLDFTAASLLSLNTNTNGYSSSCETLRQGRFHRRTSSIILNSILVPSNKESTSNHDEYLIDTEREEKGTTTPRARPSFAGSCSSNTTGTSESCSSQRSSDADINNERQQLDSTGVEESDYLLGSFKPVRVGRSVNRYNSLEWLDVALSTPSTGQQTNRFNTSVGHNTYTGYSNFNSTDQVNDFSNACQSYLNIHQNQPAEEIELNCVSSAFIPVQYQQDGFNESVLRYNYVKPCSRVGVDHPVSPMSLNSSAMGSSCSEECECEEEHCDMDNKMMINNGMMYVCGKNSCQQRFDSEHSLVKHERIHSSLKNKTRDYKCVHCDKAFYTKSCLKSHEKIHTREPNSYICRIENCGKTYCTKEGLRLHTRNHHDLDKKWTCPAPFCNKSFVRQSDMRLHIMRIHSSKRPYPCTLAGCKKSFACISELRRHQNSHDRKKRKLEMKIKKEEPTNKKPKVI